jgi:hypothetical protein
MASMIIRTGYHDAMTVDTACLAAKPSNPIQCGGAGVGKRAASMSVQFVFCSSPWYQLTHLDY